MTTIVLRRVILFGVGIMCGFLLGATVAVTMHLWAPALRSFGPKKYPLWHAEAIQIQAEEDEKSLNKAAARRKWLALLRELNDICDEYPQYRTEINNNIGITHARLAVLEESARNPSAAEGQWNAACKYLRLAGWRQCNQRTVRRIMFIRSAGFP